MLEKTGVCIRFKARLDGALSNLVQWIADGRGLNYMILKVPSNPSHSMIQCFPVIILKYQFLP